MSALSRIPGIAQLASLASFSLQSNPTLRRYNDAFAQFFYHHGRLCASNQATVIFLVIVFVGMISYPGIVTSYNSSIYAHQKSFTLSGRNLSLSSWAATEHLEPSTRRRHHPHEGNLDTFWSNKVIAPTWTQDPDVFNRNLPSSHPLHYIAPVIINATDLLTTGNSDAQSEGPGTLTIPTFEPISKTRLLEYASQIQRRIEAVVVEYVTEDTGHQSMNRGLWATREHRVPRLLSLRDICVQAPMQHTQERQEAAEDGVENDEHPCLVHRPWDGDAFQNNGHDAQQQSTSFVFGGMSFDDDGDDDDDEVTQDWKHASLVISFFLRGDLDNSAPWSSHQQYHSRSHEFNTEYRDLSRETVDVRRVWHMIFSKFASELQQERAQRYSQGSSDPTVGELGQGDRDNSDTEYDSNQIQYQDGDDGVGLSPSSRYFDTSKTPFMVRAISGADSPQHVSRRLVTDESTQLRTNISVEHWLLVTAYLVMFLYISLSVGKVDLVKSKYGLGIAAVATVSVSLLMSIGICSLFGVTLTLMPWEILPFMVIVVGVENIKILVHAVVETSIDMSVKERVGRGLGAVGVSITLTLVAELCLLVIGAMVAIPAVQEFCKFAIAAVIMDYLLQMTFFITVISIDIRRLELSDLSIRHGAHSSRYLSSARHTPLKSGHLFNELEPYHYEEERTRHRRNDSSTSQHSEGESKSSGKRAKPNRRIFTSFLMVAVMGYLYYIYGATNQSVADEQGPVVVSYWRIVSTEAASDFWTMIDPSQTGGFIEIEAPAVVALVKPFNATTHHAGCYGLSDTFESDDCEEEQDGTATLQIGQRTEKLARLEGLLDPKRPFKLLGNALDFIWTFLKWLVFVFVLPSIVLAAAILLLLSYLLSPQRKLLVDLQWGFPFIVLPGDYQSKQKIMMEEFLAQEARVHGQELSPSTPLPATVETLYHGGHKADIDQMVTSADGRVILTSSLDGAILLWNGSIGSEHRVPLARLEEGIQGIRSTLKTPKSRPAKFLRLDPSGEMAIAGFSDGGIQVWNLGSVWQHSESLGDHQILRIRSGFELQREQESTTTDVSKLRVSSVCFAASSLTEGTTGHSTTTRTSSPLLLLLGYRDGQIWQWDLIKGQGRCIMETKLRGGVAELATIELNANTRRDLGLRDKTYLMAVGKDGGIQCWSTPKPHAGGPKESSWTLLWSQPGLGTGIGVSVLSLDPEVPMAAVGYSNGAIKIWDLEHGNIVWTLSCGVTPSTGLPGASSGSQHDGRVGNYQLSHQGAITKLFFHALEVENQQGEAVPRVWLVVSSSMDETVMVWVVEWEGMMCMPTRPHHHRHGSLSGDISPARRGSATYGHDQQQQQQQPRLPRTPSFGPNGFMRDNLTTDYMGTLSSSLPAPRLVGFLKQRGGKSVTISNSRLYGVRRTESSTAVVGDRVDARKPSHTSALDGLAPNSSQARSRRKSDSLTGTQEQQQQQQQQQQQPISNSSSSGPARRGWELWEANLYHCIICSHQEARGLDLPVSTIDLQPPPPQPQEKTSRGFTVQRAEPDLGSGRHAGPKTTTTTHEGTGSVESMMPIMINTNGSSIPVPAFIHTDSSNNYDPRPRVQRKPGSFSHHARQQQQQQQHQGQPFTTTKASPSQHNPSMASMESNLTTFYDSGAAALLPFVETRLVLGLSRRPGGLQQQQQQQPSYYYDYEAEELGKEPDMKDIVIGFGNYIKIVRLQDDDEGEGETSA
ncbi:hypothetical protein B0O80DRAFT_498889 [Mortierella sp. GBAus27b]|nr:hypothetical protein B0O80DRAFT_498889 [Mortierella sp. GBAus27b]